jgi:hypothetical protein
MMILDGKERSRTYLGQMNLARRGYSLSVETGGVVTADDTGQRRRYR